MHQVIARLALLLKLDPAKNDLDVGGDVLWSRIKQWRWPERNLSAER